jgi:hypothetical protein
MRCAVVGKKAMWIFEAQNEEKGEMIAGEILVLEVIYDGKGIMCSFSRKSSWVAYPLNIDIVKGKKIIEIKKSRGKKVDALYVTRKQTERMEKPL